MITPVKVVGVLEPRIGKRFTRLDDNYIPDVATFSAFDRAFLKGIGWDWRVVKVTECNI